MTKFLSKDGKFYMRDGKLLGYTPPPSSPTLAANSNWYKGSTAKSTITAIEIKDSYTPTGTVTEQWNADVDNSGSIKAYVEGTKLTIAGNGAGKIMANADSFETFSGFSSATSFSRLNLLDTANVTDMSFMFDGCKALTSVGDLSGWNTSNVTDMSNMFYGCNALTDLDLSGWNTSKVRNMMQMFRNCTALTSLDVSGWDTSKVTNMSNIFYSCIRLQFVTLGKDFKFVGTSGYLPVPSSKYITSATGKWYAPDGTSYTPEELAAITRTLTTTYSATPPGEII